MSSWSNWKPALSHGQLKKMWPRWALNLSLQNGQVIQYYAGQWLPCLDRARLTTTWMPNIKWMRDATNRGCMSVTILCESIAARTCMPTNNTASRDNPQCSNQFMSVLYFPTWVLGFGWRPLRAAGAPLEIITLKSCKVRHVTSQHRKNQLLHCRICSVTDPAEFNVVGRLPNRMQGQFGPPVLHMLKSLDWSITHVQ